MLFQSITTFPLHKFIELAIDGNVYSVVKEGRPADMEIEKAANNLIQEYNDCIGDATHTAKSKLYRDIVYLSIRLKQIACCIEALNVCKYKPIEDRLNAYLNANLSFNNYSVDLPRCIRLMKHVQLKLSMKQSSYETITKAEGGEALTREFFYSWLTVLSDASKIYLTDQITTYDFCTRIKRLTESKKQNNAGQSK